MKRRLLHLVTLVSLLLVFTGSGLASVISPYLAVPSASAAMGSDYVFSTPSDADFLKSFKTAVDKGDEGADAFASTGVYVRGKVFGETPFELKLDTGKTGCAQAAQKSLSDCAGNVGSLLGGSSGHFGGQANDVYVYSASYTCQDGKLVNGPDDTKDSWDVTYDVSMKIGKTGEDHAIFDSAGNINPTAKLHWVGFGSLDKAGVHHNFASSAGTAANSEDSSIKSLPPECRPPDVPQEVLNSNSNDTETAKNGIVNVDVPVLSSNKTDASIKKSWGDVANTASNGTGSATDATDSVPGLSCKIKATNPLTWLLCPAVKGMVNIIGGLDDLITSQLSVGTPGNSSDPSQIFCNDVNGGGSCSNTSNAYRTAWASVRNIALGLIVVAGLVIVISQALGFEILDAYTIRKVLPRLIISAMAITLSWQLMHLFVTFTNDLGYGIRYIIYHPFASGGFGHTEVLGGGGKVAASIIGYGALSAFGIFGLLSFAVTGAMAVFIAFLILIIRQMVIIVLIIFAPVALVAYILPNTQNVYKLWFDSFAKALLMFPIISALIAAGRVLSLVSGASDGGNPVGQLIGFAAYFAPYFLMPLAFRFAGGALRGIGGFVNDRGRGGFDRLKKFRQGQFQSHGGRKIESANRRVLAKRVGANAAMQNFASRSNSALVRGAVGRFASTTAGYNLSAIESAKQAEVAKELNDQIATGRDDEIRGLLIDKSSAETRTGSNGQKQFRSLGGGWVDEAAVDAGQRRWGNDKFAKQAALSYEMRKADSIEDIDRIKNNYMNTATRGGMTRAEASGAWIGAAFENQNQHLELKHMSADENGVMSMNAVQAQAFASEAYEKKGTYQLSQMHASTIRQLSNAHDIAAADTDRSRGTNTQNQIATVAENFVSRFGAGAAGGPADDPAIQAHLQQQQQQAIQQAQAAQAGAQGGGQVQAGGQVQLPNGVGGYPTGGQLINPTTGQPFQGPAAQRGGGAPGTNQNITANSSGAANVAAEVRKLTVKTGVLQDLRPSAPDNMPPPPPVDRLR